MNRIVRYGSLLLGLLIPCCLMAQVPEFTFQYPELAGTLRLGLVNGEKSVWLQDCKNVKVKQDKPVTTYTVKDPWGGKGELTVRVRPLNDTKGSVMEVEATGLPGGYALAWGFGGCLGAKVPEDHKGTLLHPDYCKDNVFSVEGTAFAVYYGNSRALRIFQAVTPPASDIRLSDARQQETPLAFHRSGKKTDAPALAATCPLANGEKVYFCFYRHAPKADYNYFMMPELYRTGSFAVQGESNWMKSTPD